MNSCSKRLRRRWPKFAVGKKEMEGVYSLEVPLIVDVGTGPNWRDAK